MTVHTDFSDVVDSDDYETVEEKNNDHGVSLFNRLHSSPRIRKDDWPDLSCKGRPLNTVRNLMFLLKFYDVKVQYNVISNQIEIEIGNSDADQFDLTCSYDAKRNTILSLVQLNELPRVDFDDYIFTIAALQTRNPALEFMTRKAWDGRTRLPDLIDTLILKDGFCKKKAELLLRRWMISAAAAAAVPTGFRTRGVLVLQGDQSLGKTQWFRELLPTEERKMLKADHFLSPYDKDSILIATSHWLVELGEIDAMFRKTDVTRLNGFLTSDEDQLRPPYGRRSMTFPRRTVFFGTTNPSQFITDDTGSTRWWVIPCADVVLNSGINMQQVWAEVYAMYRSGQQW